MPAHEIDLAVLLRSLDDDSFIAEALLYPEISRLGTNPKSLERSVVSNTVQILEKENLARVWSRLNPTDVDTFELHLRLEPQTNSSWREPIELRLDVVRWSLNEGSHIAFIPVLGIEVISTKLSDLKPGNSKDSLLERHARAELQRRGVLVDFKDLLLLQRTRGLEKRNLRLAWTERLVDHLAGVGFSARFGARPLQRTIEQEIVTQLAFYLNRKSQLRGAQLTVDFYLEQQKTTISEGVIP